MKERKRGSWEATQIQAAEAILALSGYYTLNIKCPHKVVCWSPDGRVICGGDKVMK